MSLGSAFSKIQRGITSGGLSFIPTGPEGDDAGAANAKAEEERKANLRKRIDRFYGIGTPTTTSRRTFSGELDEAGNQVFKDEDITVPDAEAEAAHAAMQAENTKLSDATRQYYADQLGQDYQKAERNTRFKLARQGLLGSSEDVAQQGELKSDRDLGATRVDDAVRRAVANLTSQREQERLNAISLANSGSGDSAVSAAQSGLRNSFENVSSQQKADLFGDLFSNSADAVATSNVANNEAALAARYRDRLNAFFPNTGRTSSGRVTAS